MLEYKWRCLGKVKEKVKEKEEHHRPLHVPTQLVFSEGRVDTTYVTWCVGGGEREGEEGEEEGGEGKQGVADYLIIAPHHFFFLLSLTLFLLSLNSSFNRYSNYHVHYFSS